MAALLAFSFGVIARDLESALVCCSVGTVLCHWCRLCAVFAGRHAAHAVPRVAPASPPSLPQPLMPLLFQATDLAPVLHTHIHTRSHLNTHSCAHTFTQTRGYFFLAMRARWHLHKVSAVLASVHRVSHRRRLKRAANSPVCAAC